MVVSNIRLENAVHLLLVILDEHEYFGLEPEYKYEKRTLQEF